MKILITGAHFTPAQAVIEQLIKDPKIELVYVGRKNTMERDKTSSVESQILPKLGIRFINLTAGRLSLIPSLNSIISLFKIPIGFIQGFWIIFKEQPDVTLSFGGYISVPIVVSSFLLSVPVITHEQTLVLGLANRINSYFATKVAISFNKNLGISLEKTVFTGNPLRSELLSQIKTNSAVSKFINKSRLPLIYITGGNQGSREINQQIKAILPELLEFSTIIHQTGDSKYNDFDDLSKYINSLKFKERYLVQKWFDVTDVSQILQSADLAITRSGINTLYELAYFGVPVLTIPLPYLYKNEQMVNAKFFSELKLCEIIPQSQLNPNSLLEKIRLMIKNISSYKKTAQQAKMIVKTNAAQNLCIEVLSLANRHD